MTQNKTETIGWYTTDQEGYDEGSYRDIAVESNHALMYIQ